jgi:hypothetical protein
VRILLVAYDDMLGEAMMVTVTLPFTLAHAHMRPAA